MTRQERFDRVGILLKLDGAVLHEFDTELIGFHCNENDESVLTRFYHLIRRADDFDLLFSTDISSVLIDNIRPVGYNGGDIEPYVPDKQR